MKLYTSSLFTLLKAFPWGDGDKSLFHNEKFNVGPDTDFDAEDEHTDNHKEVSSVLPIPLNLL